MKTQPTDEKWTEILFDLLIEFYNQLICYFFFFQIINQLSNYTTEKLTYAYKFMVQVASL